MYIDVLKDIEDARLSVEEELFEKESVTNVRKKPWAKSSWSAHLGPVCKPCILSYDLRSQCFTVYRYLTKRHFKIINALPCISKLSAAIRLWRFTL